MKVNSISVSVIINAPIAKVWTLWTTPEDIKQWNNFSAEWQVTHVENNLYPGGRFIFAMGLKDESLKFDFEGTYNEVKPFELISYKLDDGRRATNLFDFEGDAIKLTETFEPTETEPTDMQRDFCNTILNSFKTYTEQKK